MPTSNSEEFVTKSIESVLHQSYNNIELIIVDDCSSDKTKEIIESYAKQDTRVKVIIFEKNSGGPAMPRNTGIENSKGDYIAFLDSDDIWEENKLYVEMNFLEKNNADIVASLAYLIDEDNNIIGESKQDIFRNYLSKLKLPPHKIILYTNFININTVLMKKSKSLTFNQSEKLVAIEDWLYWIEYLSATIKVFILKEKLIKYRVRNSSISARTTIKSYKKIFHLYKLLFQIKRIGYLEYFTLNALNLIKLIRRKIGLA